MLISPMLLGAFRPQKPENRIVLRYALNGHGDTNAKRACMAAENVDVAAGHNKLLAVLVLGPREKPWRVRQLRASVVEKLRAA